MGTSNRHFKLSTIKCRDAVVVSDCLKYVIDDRLRIGHLERWCSGFLIQVKQDEITVYKSYLPPAPAPETRQRRAAQRPAGEHKGPQETEPPSAEAGETASQGL